MADPEPTQEPTPEPTPVPDNWKADLEESRKARDAAKEAARKASEELETLKAERAREKEEREEIKRKAEEEKLKSEGKYKELYDKQEAEFKEKLALKDKRYVERVIPGEIAAAATELGNITPEAIKDLPNMLANRIGFDPETLDIFVKDAEGKPLKDDKLNPVSIKDFVANYTSERSYMLVDKQVQGTGAKPGGPKHSQADRTMEKALRDSELRAEWLEADPEGYEKARKAYFNPRAVKERAAKKYV